MRKKPIITFDVQIRRKGVTIHLPDSYGSYSQPDIIQAMAFVDRFMIGIDDRRTFEYQMSTGQARVAVMFRKTPGKTIDVRKAERLAIAAAKAYLANQQQIAAA
jgi:hypothetical protein